MAIRNFSGGPERKKIICFGDEPPAELQPAFKVRGYEIVRSTEINLLDLANLTDVDSIVIAVDESSLSSILTILEQHAVNCLNYGCNIYVVVPISKRMGGKAREVVLNAIRGCKLAPANVERGEWETFSDDFKDPEQVSLIPYVYVCDAATTWFDLAKYIQNNPAAKSPKVESTLPIVARDSSGKPIALSPVMELLLRRAFWDCRSIDLVKMDDGLSGVSVFRAFTELEKGMLGAAPYRSFVKIGSRKKVVAEFLSYQSAALMYVPFHLGPRLTLDRCCLGANDGIIVGDYVDEAEQLRKCASDGRAIHAIANLFSKTLRTWQDLSKEDKTVELTRLLLEIIPFPSAIPPHRAQFVSDLGARQTPAQLNARFMARKSSPVRVGPVHGDLHATNVLVRGADAIVIDFEKAQPNRPLLYDLASLEAGLLVDGFRRDKRSAREILDSVRDLYSGGVHLGSGTTCHPRNDSRWFYDCVRQIRMHAAQLECKGGQYATALALCLVKKACNPEQFDDRRQELRAIAYCMAEIVLS